MFIKPDSYLGVGLNYRSEIAEDIIKNIKKIDFIEVNTELFYNRYSNHEQLEKIISSIPIVLHGL